MENLSSVAAHAAKEDSCRAPKSAVRILRGDRSARLTTERYIKDQRPTVPRRTTILYQIAARGFNRGAAKKLLKTFGSSVFSGDRDHGMHRNAFGGTESG